MQLILNKNSTINQSCFFDEHLFELLESIKIVSWPNNAILTPSEQVILSHFMLGRSDKEISRELNRSIHTVKNHVKNILRKLNFRKKIDVSAYIYYVNTSINKSRKC